MSDELIRQEMFKWTSKEQILSRNKGNMKMGFSVIKIIKAYSYSTSFQNKEIGKDY